VSGGGVVGHDIAEVLEPVQLLPTNKAQTRTRRGSVTVKAYPNGYAEEKCYVGLSTTRPMPPHTPARLTAPARTASQVMLSYSCPPPSPG
jgi:hypothetical protein